jgi:hypothetical protein
MVQSQKKQHQSSAKKVEMPAECKRCKRKQCLDDDCVHIEAYKKYLQNAVEQL